MLLTVSLRHILLSSLFPGKQGLVSTAVSAKSHHPTRNVSTIPIVEQVQLDFLTLLLISTCWYRGYLLKSLNGQRERCGDGGGGGLKAFKWKLLTIILLRLGFEFGLGEGWQ